MKKTSLLLCALIICFQCFAQPICNKAGDYEIGEVYQYQNCDPTNVWEGPNGLNQVWNFSNLLLIPFDTITLRIVHTTSTPYDSLFSSATMAEYFSDGRYYFVNKTTTDNYYTGMVDVNNSITMFYENTNRIVHRPLNSTTNIVDDYSEHFTYQTYDLTGSGTTEITGMGYGTLILPNDTIYNVLKVKTTQVQVDTIIQFSNFSTNTFVTWEWFDTSNKAPLLRIDSVDNPGFVDKYVYYLVNQSTVAVNNLEQDKNHFSFSPNPANNNITLHHLEEGTLSITNQLGQMVYCIPIEKGVVTKTLSIEQLKSGLYFISYKTKDKLIVDKLVVE